MTTDLAFFLLRPDGEQTGTFSLYQVKMMQKTGFIGPDTRFWMEGMTEWLPVTRIEEFIDFRPPISSAHTGPPKPQTWSGSLARAIPSPHQKSSPLTNIGATLAPRRMEGPPAETKPSVPEIPPVKRQEPSPVISPESDDAVEPIQERETDPLAWEDEELEERSKPGHLAVYLLAVLGVAVLAIVSAAAFWLAHKNFDPFGSITFSGPNVFVLLDQGSIRPFQGDLVNSPVLNDFNLRIAQTDDQDTLKKLKTGLDQESARHRDEIELQYVQDAKAQLIEPGKYRVVGYFNTEGQTIVPGDGEAWVAIVYKDTIVYAHTDASAGP